MDPRSSRSAKRWAPYAPRENHGKRLLLVEILQHLSKVPPHFRQKLLETS